MKKTISFFLLLIMMLSSISSAFAAFPTAEELFGTFMPSARYAIGRMPDDVILAENGVTEVYSGFSLYDYRCFGRYLASAGCEVTDTDVDTQEKSLSVTISDGGRIEMEYRYGLQILSVFYPEGTRPEKEKNSGWTDSEWPAGILPFDETVFLGYYPSLTMAVGREPDSVEEDGGSRILLFADFSDCEYDAFSRYLAGKNCSTADYILEGSKVSVTVAFDGSEFVFGYDREKKAASVSYPMDRHIEGEAYIGLMDNASETSLLPKADAIKILYMNIKDITPENNWPILYVGEKINISAAAYPAEIQNPTFEWSCSDTEGKYLKMTARDDGTVDLECVGSIYEGVTVSAACEGISQSIRVYCAA